MICVSILAGEIPAVEVITMAIFLGPAISLVGTFTRKGKV